MKLLEKKDLKYVSKLLSTKCESPLTLYTHRYTLFIYPSAQKKGQYDTHRYHCQTIQSCVFLFASSLTQFTIIILLFSPLTLLND